MRVLLGTPFCNLYAAHDGGLVQNTQMTQMAQMTQATHICSKCLKHADGGGADGDFSSACFRRSKIRMSLLRFILRIVALEIM